MSRGALCIHIRGEELVLHPGRAILWPRRKTVVVADTHFGKSSFFGRHGVAVPAGSDDEDRTRLRRLIVDSRADHLLVLGDFVHAPLAPDGPDALDLETWARSLAPVQITVIAGNHDRGAKFPSRINRHVGELMVPPFRFLHEAKPRETPDEFYYLSGHIHPVMRLRGNRGQGLRVPVFWQRPADLVLPAFGSFTGGYAVRPQPGENLFAAGPDAVTCMSAPDSYTELDARGPLKRPFE